MDLVSRLPKTVLVTVLALLLFGGTTGIVSAAGDPDLPERLVLPAPQAGDRWQYDVDFQVEGPGMSDASQETVVYEWLPSERFLDADGAWRVVHPLLEQSTGIDASWWNAYLVDANSGEVVATRDRSTSGGASGFARHLGGVTVNEGTQEERGEAVITRFQPFPPPCGYWSAAQGNEVRLDRAVAFRGLCDVDPASADVFTLDGGLRARDVERIAGMPTVRFTHHAPITDEVGMDITLWMSPSIPYPVRSLYQMGFEVEAQGQTVRFAFELALEMTGFERGAGWDEAPGSASTVPDVVRAPRQPWGPDDSGIDMAFGARDAWLVAQMEEDSAQWMEDHDDAQALVANYTETSFADRIERTWTFLAAERRDGALIQVTQVEFHDPVMEAISAAVGRHRIAMAEYDVPDVQLPSLLPTVRSVQARWEAITGGVANAYGFEVCFGEPACEVRIMAGSVHATDTASGVPNPVEPQEDTFHEERHLLVVDEGGRPLQLRDTEREETRYESGLGDPGPSREWRANVPLATLSTIETHWAFPSAPAATSVAVGAVLVGLGYWLWPLAKSGGFIGLFSRVQRDEMLEHPVRRTILEAVQGAPGIHYQQLIRTVGKGRGTVEHHLRKLQEGGYVVAHSNAGHTCFFVTGAMDHSVMAAVPAIRTEGAAKVLAYVQYRPGVRSSDLAAALGVSRSTASHHVRRLRDAGLVEDTGAGLVPSRLAAPAMAALATQAGRRVPQTDQWIPVAA